MEHARVVVCGETPSLASSLAELLEVEGIPVLRVPSLERVRPPPAGEREGLPSVLISTATGYGADTVRKWREGPFRHRDLILVGTREPGLRSEGQLHVTRLPIVPEEFLELVRHLLVRQAREHLIASPVDPNVG